MTYVVKNNSDRCVGNRQRASKVKARPPERRLLWRAGREKVVAWATVVELGRGGHRRDSYEGERT